jgi:dual specificity protein kinase YAK1
MSYHNHIHILDPPLTHLQVIKNQPAYYHQARVEVGILQLLNGRCDPGDCHHIVRLHDAFLHRRHLCLAFEQLGINLFELLKRNGFRGLSLGLLRLFLQQVRTPAAVFCCAHSMFAAEEEQLQGAQPTAAGVLPAAGSACFNWFAVPRL